MLRVASHAVFLTRRCVVGEGVIACARGDPPLDLRVTLETLEPARARAEIMARRAARNFVQLFVGVRERPR